MKGTKESDRRRPMSLERLDDVCAELRIVSYSLGDAFAGAGGASDLVDDLQALVDELRRAL